MELRDQPLQPPMQARTAASGDITNRLEIDYAVMTVARPQQYIHRLIAELRSDLPLRVVVGGSNCEYLERYRNSSQIEIFAPPAEEWAFFAQRGVHHRATWNYWRSLVFGARNPERKGLVVFEDDVFPARGWEQRLHETIDQIEAQHTGRYLMALYAATQAGLPQPVSGSHFVPYPVSWFFGTQAIYFPEAERVGFAGYLKENGVDKYRLPYDYVLREYMQKSGVSIFATIPCLVQHIGEVSTGLGLPHSTHHFQAEL